MKALEEIKARVEVLAYEGPLEVRVTENLRWADVYPKAETTHPERLARCADDDYAELFAHAPEDLAKVIAALEAVDKLAESWHDAYISSASEFNDIRDDAAYEIEQAITEALA